MQILNEQQQRAVDSVAPRILVVASPGSGKSRVLIERIRRLLRDGAAPGSIVAISFTNAAANIITERLGGQQLGFCGTLHSFALKLLREHGSILGFGPTLGVMDADQEERLRAQCFDELKVTVTQRDFAGAVALHPNRPRNGVGVNLTHAQLAAAHFVQTLRKSNLLTFDLLLAFGLKLLLDWPEQVAGSYMHLATDEHQDSTAMDAEIYAALPIPNKFHVGDPDQAIMSFRGGDMANIIALSKTPGIESITLENNYRCCASVCSAANHLIEHNIDRIPKHTRSATDETGSVTVTAHTSESGEIEWLCDIIRSLWAEDCAVLVRTNALVDRFARALRGAGIPVAETRRPELPPDWQRAKLLIALLNDPENDRLAEWWLEGRDGTVAARHARLQAQSQRMSINQQVLKLPTGLPPAAVAESLARAGLGVETITRVEIEAGRLQGGQPGATLADLALALAASERDSETKGEGVTVSTVHSAKGREWGTVLLPAFEDEILPGIAKSTDLEESRRIAFVAITRAKHALYVSHAASRMPQFAATRPKPATPSRFIAEMALLPERAGADAGAERV